MKVFTNTEGKRFTFENDGLALSIQEYLNISFDQSCPDYLDYDKRTKIDDYIQTRHSRIEKGSCLKKLLSKSIGKLVNNAKW